MINNDRTNLYIATFSLIPEEGITIYDAGRKFVSDVTPYLTPLFFDVIGGYDVRVLTKKQDGAVIPSLFNRIVQRPVKTILKKNYGIPLNVRKALSVGVYAWFDGDVSGKEDLEKMRDYLFDIPNVGPSFISARGDDIQMHIRGFGVGEEGMKELNSKLLEMPLPNPRVYSVVGPSIIEVGELNDDLSHLLL